jgi:hypothetical protein
MNLITYQIQAQHNCLPKSLNHLENNSKYILKTVKAPTYDEAEQLLLKEMPSSGFLQNVKVEEIKKLTERSYTEQRSVKTSFNANVDMWLKYPCQHKGDYYITAIIGKTDVSYMKTKYPNWITLKNIKKFCDGYSKIYIVAGNDLVYGEKKKELYREGEEGLRNMMWTVSCGDSATKMPGAYDDNKFHDFRVVKGFRGFFEDITADMWLDLTKQIQ